MNDKTINRSGRSNKFIILTILLITIILLVIGAVCRNIYIKKHEKPVYTEYELTEQEAFILSMGLGIEIGPGGLVLYNEEENYPDYRYYKMKKTEKTDKWVYEFNNCIYVKFADEEVESQKLLAQYGFDSDNWVTTDWIMTHPKELLEVLNVIGHKTEHCIY